MKKILFSLASLLASASFYAQAPGGISQPSATTNGGILSSGVNGLDYTLYNLVNDTNANGLDLTTATPFNNALFTNIGTGYFKNLDNPDNEVVNRIADYFGLLIKTELLITNAGSYKFEFDNIDDKAVLFVNGVQVLNQTATGSSSTAALALTAGYNTIEVRYVERNGGEILRVRWSGGVGLDVTATTFQVIPDSKFYSIPKLMAWYKANAGVTATGEGTNTTAWTDSSTNANNLALVGAGNPLFYGTTAAQLANFNASISFTDDQLRNTNANNVTKGISLGRHGKSVFAVVSKPSLGTSAGFITNVGRDVVAFSSYGLATNTGDIVQLNVNGGTNLNSSSFLKFDKQALISGVYKNQSITTVNPGTLYGDGKQLATGNTNPYTSLNDGQSIAVGFGIDGEYDGHDGNIAEVIHFPWDLSTIDRQKVESYLAVKYGISFDQTAATDYVFSDGAKFWTSALNVSAAGPATNYKSAIFGIAKDAASALDQRISKSAEFDIVTLSTDAVYMNENTTHAAVAADKSAFMMSTNNANVVIQSTEVMAGFTQRLSREWRVSKTNFTQAINMKFEGYNNQWVLVSDADGDFSAGATVVGPLSGTGGITSSAIADGAFLTLAKTSTTSPGGVAANLRVWLRADQGFLPSQWSDQSGNGNDFTQTTLEIQPTRTAPSAAYNFNPSVNFEKTTAVTPNIKFMVVPTGKPFTANDLNGTVLLANNNSTFAGADQSYFGFGATTTGTNLVNPDFPSFEEAAGTPYLYSNGAQRLPTTPIPMTAGKTSISDYRWLDGAVGASTPVSIARDGLLGLNGASVPCSDTRTALGAVIGSTAGNELLGQIPELIAYERVLTVAELQQVRSYMALKYGISMDQTTASNDYVSSAGLGYWVKAANTGYLNNIFGIGKDVNGGLEQQISKSVAAGDIVTLSSDSNFAAANGTHAAVSADKSFFVLSNNGGGVLPAGQTTELEPITYTVRLVREWKASNVGFAQSVNLQFTGFDATWSLLIDADGDFTSGATNAGALSATGSISTTAIANGQYITLAKVNTVLATTGSNAAAGTVGTLTAAQFNTVLPGSTDPAIAANNAAYNAYVVANPTMFANPATPAQIQAMVTAVNAQQAILATIGTAANGPATSSTTAAQYNSLPGVSGAIVGNEAAYNAYIDANVPVFSSPATPAQVQAMITEVNANQAILAQIGTSADAGTNPGLTAAQINSIPGVTAPIATAANIADLNAYIAANPAAFSSPATAAELQAAIIAVDATASTLATIGTSADAGTNPNLTTAQLASIPGVTGVTAANTAAINAYIAANAGAFSSPATAAQLQAAVTQVNANQAALTTIGTSADAGTNPNLTAAQINSLPGITAPGATATNIAAINAYIAANPNAFSSPATIAEINAAIAAVNAALSAESFEAFARLSVYPNPFVTSVTVILNSDAKMDLCDMMGKLILTNNLISGSNTVDLSSLPTGVYLVKFTNENNENKTLKVVKQ